MAYTPREIKDRVAVGDDIFIVEDLGDNRIKLIPAPTHVSEPGTPINKALLQPIEDYLATGVVPVERTITVGDGLIGGGDLSADRTLKIDFATNSEAEEGTNNTKLMTPLRVAQAIRSQVGTPATLSGITSNTVNPLDGWHTHAISVATYNEAISDTNNSKLMTPRRVAEAFNKHLASAVVFARVDPENLPSFATVTRLASSPSDYNTIKFTAFLGEGENSRAFSLVFPSLGNVVVGTPQYLLSTSSTLSSSEMLEFRYFSPENKLTFGAVTIYYGITMFRQNRVEFIITRELEGSAAINDIYLHFRFTGLKLA